MSLTALIPYRESSSESTSTRAGTLPAQISVSYFSFPMIWRTRTGVRIQRASPDDGGHLGYSHLLVCERLLGVVKAIHSFLRPMSRGISD